MDWGIGLRRLGCGCGRRLVTGSCVIRETTQTGCPWSRPRVSLSIYLSIYLSIRAFFTGSNLIARTRGRARDGRGATTPQHPVSATDGAVRAGHHRCHHHRPPRWRAGCHQLLPVHLLPARSQLWVLPDATVSSAATPAATPAADRSEASWDLQPVRLRGRTGPAATATAATTAVSAISATTSAAATGVRRATRWLLRLCKATGARSRPLRSRDVCREAGPRSAAAAARRCGNVRGFVARPCRRRRTDLGKRRLRLSHRVRSARQVYATSASASRRKQRGRLQPIRRGCVREAVRDVLQRLTVTESGRLSGVSGSQFLPV